MTRGQATFLGICSTCHQKDGKGLPGVFPPLEKSDYLMADRERSIRLVLAGLTGPVKVNGIDYNGVMPPLANLTDHEVADTLTYVRNSFGNKGDAVEDAEVAAVRASLKAPDTTGPLGEAVARSLDGGAGRARPLRLRGIQHQPFHRQSRIPVHVGLDRRWPMARCHGRQTVRAAVRGGKGALLLTSQAARLSGSPTVGAAPQASTSATARKL